MHVWQVRVSKYSCLSALTPSPGHSHVCLFLAKGCYGRRNNGRPGWGKSKKREHPPRNPINLKQLSTMITLNEGSTDHVESPVTSPGTATPSPAPGSLKPPTRGGIGIEGNDHTDKSLKPSPKSPATTAPEQDNGRDATSDRSSGKRRASDPQGGGGEHEKRGGDGGTARKRGSGARGVVAVDADEGSAGKDGARVEIFSGTHPEKAPRLSVQVWGKWVFRGREAFLAGREDTIMSSSCKTIGKGALTLIERGAVAVAPLPL